jgi:hypothetical protein
MRRQVAMDRIAGKRSVYPDMARGWIGRQGGAALMAMVSAACVILFAGEAGAQCSARDVLRKHLTLKTTPSSNARPVPVTSAFAVPVWRTITVGTFANSFALLNALDAARCSVGGLAEEVLARPAFTVGTRKTSVELFAVSAAELGFHADSARLVDIFARAQQLGFGLAAAEVAPQLRLQFRDQPMGEFLIGMEPIKTWKGEPVILAVANGGEGLVLIGRDGGADAEIPVTARFLFTRSNEAALAKEASAEETPAPGRR